MVLSTPGSIVVWGYSDRTNGSYPGMGHPVDTGHGTPQAKGSRNEGNSHFGSADDPDPALRPHRAISRDDAPARTVAAIRARWIDRDGTGRLDAACTWHRSQAGQVRRIRPTRAPVSAMTTLVSPTMTPRRALYRAVLGASFVLVIALLPMWSSKLYSVALLGVWICFASLIRYAALLAERPSPPESTRWIPLRFSGPIGRFRLRPRGDGRRVEVRASLQVVAEVIAADAGDEIVLDPEGVADSELEAFGTAIGRAIEMAAAADEDRPAERHRAGPASWGKA